jgi:hypothetical protein
LKWEVGMRNAEGGSLNSEVGMRNVEGGKERRWEGFELGSRNVEVGKERRWEGVRQSEGGLRPIGVFAYAPAGMRKWE